MIRPFGNRHGPHAAAALLVFAAATGCVVAPSGPPEGSYLETCRNVEVHRGMLTADCLRADSQTWNRSALDLDRCRGGGVENWDGQLTCGGGGYGYGPPPPPYPYGR
ncbi:MAG TPA: CVNH domain-containing protein [Alphaproteobacteria bacterium]|nr:CVNH domain-containing protein [Alphaproteobacteria bacterium]